MEQAEYFRRHTEGVVADFYDVDCVKQRVFNSDGGVWLQRNMVPKCVFQLDPFHRNRTVRTYVDDPELQQTILDLLHARKAKEAIAVVEASIESTLDPVEQEKRRNTACHQIPIKSPDTITCQTQFWQVIFLQ